VPTRFDPGAKSTWTSISDIAAPVGATQPHSLRQFLGGQSDTDRVVACIREFAQSIKKTQGLKRSGVDANAYRWVTLFDPVKARATGEGALRHDCRR
jgi:hypothetical protein